MPTLLWPESSNSMLPFEEQMSWMGGWGFVAAAGLGGWGDFAATATLMTFDGRDMVDYFCFVLTGCVWFVPGFGFV